MFEKASRLKLRFQTPKGQVSAEDLWDLSLPHLNIVAKDLHKQLKESAEPDFIEEKSAEDTVTKLKFDLVIHIMDVKKEEQKARLVAAQRKEERTKLTELLARKREGALESLSVEEIEAKLKELE
jgi:hypothetical protein